MAKPFVATCYLQIEPTRSTYAPDLITGARITKMTQTRPDTATGLVVQLNLTVSNGMFEPIKIDITLDESSAITTALEDLQKWGK